MKILLSEFDFDLPKELIAKYPQKIRDNCKLLVYNKTTDKIEHTIFKNIVEFFQQDTCLVLNNTKVMKARLYGKKITGGKLEILFIEQISTKVIKCLIRPSIPVGKYIYLGNFRAKIIDKQQSIAFLEFEEAFDIFDLMEKSGEVPLPYYIKRKTENIDEIYYQTVYASQPGSIASPTAGLHFTQSLLETIRRNGTDIAYCTLHIGYDTFRPIKTNDVTEHKMLGEKYKLDEENAQKINTAILKNKRIIATGTTTVKLLETVATDSGFVKPQEGISDLFIYPGFKFKIVNSLLTNFHLPKSTNLLLVAALIGREKTLKIYNEAIKNNYKFYSYGDAMLIL